MEYRNEYKYICSQNELIILKSRLLPLISLDRHLQNKESYNIRSLYFDDYNDSCMKENEAGLDNRKKFRIRIYNKSDQRICLEVKYKIHDKTKKESCLLSRDQCEQLMNGNKLKYSDAFERPLKMLYFEMETHMMKPVVIVEYERTAFVCGSGNVRITFDRNIASSESITQFLEDNISLHPVMPINQHILEVKYDELLPDFIAQSLELGRLQRTSFSKYYTCRFVTTKD